MLSQSYRISELEGCWRPSSPFADEDSESQMMGCFTPIQIIRVVPQFPDSDLWLFFLFLL